MSRRGRAGAGEQPEAVVQLGQHLLDGERAGAGRGQLQGQRHPVQAPADPGDRRGRLAVGVGLRGTGEEQPGGVEARQRGRVGVGGRHPQRRHPPRRLALDADRLAARGEHPYRRRLPQQPVGRPGDRLQHVLAVVQHEQAPMPRQVREHRVGPALHAQHPGQRVDDERPGRERGQLDPPHAVRVLARRGGGDPLRQPGLAAPAGAGEGEQARPGQQLGGPVEVAPASDERA
ncbi:MAG: hypothetical protein ACT4RN_15810, partial [Pseudonocardia sp.]